MVFLCDPFVFTGAGFIGSTSGSQLGNFIDENEGKRSVVLLDEFDHCEAETWEAFYHIFDEGVFTQKKVPSGGGSGGVGASGSTTRQVDCSKAIWLLTTNRFDDDIIAFNSKNEKMIGGYLDNRVSFDRLQQEFEAFIRPKLRQFFKGGLTRRIDGIVPFFKFSPEEAFVLTGADHW